MDEGLEHGHERLPVLADHTHHRLARDLVAAVDVADLHGKGEHARQAERHALGIFVAVHGHLKAVAKVNVDYFPRAAVQHQVGRMSVAQAEDVAHDRHDGQGPRIICATFEPGLGAPTLEPEDAVEIFAGGVVHGVVENLHLLHQRKIFELRGHLQHDPMLDVKEDVTFFAIFLDEIMESVAVRYPTK